MVHILHCQCNTEVASTCCQIRQRTLLTALCACAVDSEKMSKSLGNFFTIREILQKYNSLALRWFLTNSQYRQPLNFSHMSLEKVLLPPLVNTDHLPMAFRLSHNCILMQLLLQISHHGGEVIASYTVCASAGL